MAVTEDVVARLADEAGIAADYTDAFGQRVETPLSVRRGLLAALGLPAGTEEEARASLGRIHALRHGLVPPLVPVEARRAARVPVRPEGGSGTLSWRVTDERGTARDGRVALTPGTEAIELPPLTPGYHKLVVTLGERRAEATVIAAPQRCWRPRALAEEGARDWGLAAQLYGLRSADNLGIGTYADAGRAAADAGAKGAAFLGLSPVHALFSTDRQKVSPYSPSSRLFLETLYIAPSALPGFAGSRAEVLLRDSDSEIARLREASLVDHAGIWQVLSPVLEALWQDSPARAGRDTDYLAFRAAGGENLEAHATFEALAEHFAQGGANWLGDWPEAYRRNGTSEVAAFAAEHQERVSYHAWLQFLADRQFAEAAARGLATGMRLGLYRDLAVGADRGGSEIWSHPERFAAGLSIGAPPDILPRTARIGACRPSIRWSWSATASRPSGPWSRPTCAMPARSASITPSSSPGCS